MITREWIIQISSGRELDILVAEHVMGWRLETDATKLRRLDEYFQPNEGRRWWRKPEGGWHRDPPPYSSDIAAAWLVVKNMNGRGKTLFLFQSDEENEVAFGESHATSPDYVTEKSITGAICKAALIAAALHIQAASGN